MEKQLERMGDYTMERMLEMKNGAGELLAKTVRLN